MDQLPLHRVTSSTNKKTNVNTNQNLLYPERLGIFLSFSHERAQNRYKNRPGILWDFVSHVPKYRSSEKTDFFLRPLRYGPARLGTIFDPIIEVEKTTCTTLLKADPNNEAASVMMAGLAFRKVDFETAALHFRQLLLQKPTYWTALATLREVSRNMDDLDECLSRAQIAIGSSNIEAGFYYCTGLLDWRMGRLNSALRNALASSNASIKILLKKN